MALRDYRLLAIFAAICEARSLRGAARRLALSPAVVSEGLSELEGLVGQRLVERTTRRFALTAAGRDLASAAQAMVDQAASGLASVTSTRTEPRGPVSLTLPTELALGWLPDRLAALQRAHPLIEPRIHAVDTVVDLERSAIDIAVRATFALDPPATSALGTIPVILVAAPQLVADLCGPVDQRLAGLRQIGFLGQSPALISGRHRDGSPVDVAMAVSVAVNNLFVAKELAIAGFGVTRVLATSVTTDLATGRLINIAPEAWFGAVSLSIICRPGALSPAAVATVRSLEATR
ncbi:MAG: LysR family transcriptional regulator [Alphaproteobacteria bacterium]|nr:LysR family transcriptional regulator [Alphaproteobacteria bacterium]